MQLTVTSPRTISSEMTDVRKEGHVTSTIVTQSIIVTPQTLSSKEPLVTPTHSENSNHAQLSQTWTQNQTQNQTQAQIRILKASQARTPALQSTKPNMFASKSHVHPSPEAKRTRIPQLWLLSYKASRLTIRHT